MPAISGVTITLEQSQPNTSNIAPKTAQSLRPRETRRRADRQRREPMQQTSELGQEIARGCHLRVPAEPRTSRAFMFAIFSIFLTYYLYAIGVFRASYSSFLFSCTQSPLVRAKRHSRASNSCLSECVNVTIADLRARFPRQAGGAGDRAQRNFREGECLV